MRVLPLRFSISSAKAGVVNNNETRVMDFFKRPPYCLMRANAKATLEPIILLSWEVALPHNA